MKQFFVDTSGWLALLNRTDAFYATATKIYGERFAAGWNVVTHDGILLEVGNFFASSRWRASAVLWKERLAVSQQITVVHLTAELQEAGWQLYAARLDKDWGVVDCISFALMQELGLSEALTADKHFVQAGFIKLL
jgi:predicted nucleic acid-binding protein